MNIFSKIIIITCMYFYVQADNLGFALTWEQQDTALSEHAIIENTMQLWGFVDLLKVVALSSEDLELIMMRCSGYIVELYVHLRALPVSKKEGNAMKDCLTIFQSCCAELAYVEERYHQRCGLFCLLLRDMHKRITNNTIHNQC